MNHLFTQNFKTMKMFKLILIFGLIQLNGFAFDHQEEIVLRSAQRDRIVLDYQNFEDIPTRIHIRDEQGHLIYQEKRSQPNLLTKRFKFKEIKGDQLIISVENDFKVIEMSFQVMKDTIIQNGDLKRAYKPSLRKKGRQVRLNLFNPGETEVLIQVIDPEGKRLHIPIRSKERFIQKVFNVHPRIKQATFEIISDRYFQKSFWF